MDSGSSSRLSDRPVVSAEAVLCVIVGIVVAIAVFPLVDAGFTVPDDFVLSLWAHIDTTWSEIWKSATQGGRLTMISHVALSFVPYLVDSRVFLKVVQIGSMVATMLLFSFALARFSGQRFHGFVSALLFAALLQNMWEHHIVAAYPFVFQLGGFFLILALLAFKDSLTDEARSHKVRTVAFLFASLLTYEAFLTYFVIFAGLAWHGKRSSGVRAVIKSLAPVLVASAVFLAAYMAWRVAFPSDYAGIQVNLTPAKATAGLEVISQFSLAALPGYVFTHFDVLHSRFASSPAGFQRGLEFLVVNFRIEWLVKALLVGLGLALAQRIRPAQEHPTRLGLPLAAAALLIVLPAMPLAVTPKYQEWVASGAQAYVVTYFSYFGVIVALTAVAARAGTVGTAGSRKRRAAVAAGIAVAVPLSVITDYGNQAMHRSQALHQQRWRMFRLLVESADFAEVPSGSCLFLDGLTTPLAFGAYPSRLWQEWARQLTGKELTVTDDRTALGACAGVGDRPAYLVRFRQEENVANQFIGLARVRAAGAAPLIGDRMVVRWSGCSQRFALLLRSAGDNDELSATIDGREILARGSYHTFPISVPRKASGPVRADVRLPGLLLESVSTTAFVE